MGAPASVPMTTDTVARGHSIDASVDLTAGSVATHRGYLLLRNPSGVGFGIGAHADVAFWVEIEVVPISVMLVPWFPVVTRVFLLHHRSGEDAVVDANWCFHLQEGSGAV